MECTIEDESLKYSYIRNISIKINKNKYYFQIRDNQSDLNFFISIYGSCVYLTINEIYGLLIKISDQIGNKRVKNILLGDRNKIAKITYSGLEFNVLFFSDSIPEGKILLPESNIEINYEYLFLLIALIQDKSNYLWKLSNIENIKYIDGILRLFVCLISTKQNKFLEKLGWDYNIISDKYYINDLRKRTEHITTKDIKGHDIKIKYYLTQEEFDDIMELRNPSNFVDDGGMLR